MISRVSEAAVIGGGNNNYGGGGRGREDQGEWKSYCGSFSRKVARVIYARKSERGTAELEYDERDDTVRAVPSPKNQRKEPTVQTGREGSPDPKFWSPAPPACDIHGDKPNSRRRTVLNVAIESLITCRGLLFATTHFKTSM